MTITEVEQDLKMIRADQIWPVGRFVNDEPPASVTVGPENSPLELLNWHVTDPTLRRSGVDPWPRLAVIGQVLGDKYSFGHLDYQREAAPQIDELNLALQGLEQKLYVAFRRADPEGRMSHGYGAVGLRGFVMHTSMPQAGFKFAAVKQAEPIVAGRDGRPALLPGHVGWLFVSSRLVSEVE